MSQIVVHQTTLGAGELDPSMLSRIDTQAYRDGAQTIVNFLGSPLGGQRRRGGFRVVAELPLASGGVRLFRYRFSAEQQYLMAVADGTIEIYRAETLVASVAGAPWLAADLPDLSIAALADTIFIGHQDHPLQALRRHGGDDAWSLALVSLDPGPTYAFALTTGAATPASKTGETTITSTAPDFAHAEPGWIIKINAGVARIDSVTSPTVAAVTIIKELADVEKADAERWDLEEPAYSAARGYPGAVGLHGGRLYLGGSRLLPDTIFGSQVNRPYDFSLGEGRADEGLAFTIGDGEPARIRHFVSQGTLVAMTAAGWYAWPKGAITPDTMPGGSEAPVGVAAPAPLRLDGPILAITVPEGDAIQSLVEIAYNAVDERWGAQNLSLLAPNLCRRPVGMALQRHNPRDHAQHVYVLDADGSISVLSTLRSQNVDGWSRISIADGRTDFEAAAKARQLARSRAKALSIAVVDSRLYAVVARPTTIGTTRYWLEVLDPDTVLDHAAVITAPAPAAEVAVPARYEGETVDIWADGQSLGRALVAQGQVVLPVAATRVEVGWWPTAWIAPLPPVVEARNGSRAHTKQRVVRMSVRVIDTALVSLAGQRAQGFRRFGVAAFGAPPPIGSGVIEDVVLGFDRDAAPPLICHATGPCTVTAINRHVSVR